jgi:hypothetical protein
VGCTGAAGRTGLVVLAVGLVVLLGLAVLAGMLGRAVFSTLNPQRIPVDVTVTLHPDATGVRVEVSERARTGNLPSALDLGLTSVDKGILPGGGRITTARFVYSDARDGSGAVLPADQTAAGRLRSVRTDGATVRLSFHVQAVDGRRVVYPVPGSDQLSWQTVHVGPAETGATCLTNEAASDITAPVFKPCVLTGADTIDGRRNGVVRLELP